jgi:hypothetical protein
VLELEVVLENNHAAVWIYDARVSLDAQAPPVEIVPFQTDGNAGVHAMATTLLVNARTDRFRFACLYGHFSPR